MNRRQKIIVSVVGIFIVLLALVGLTYAYFLTRVIGNGETKSISVTTASLQLVYANGSSSLIQEGTLITPSNETPVGTKTFTVTNNGNGRVDNYGVFLEEFAIKYANDTVLDGVEISAGTPTSFASPNDLKLDIVCKAYDSDEYETNKDTATASNCSDMNVAYTTLPTSNDMLLSNGIDVGVTHEYTVTLTYLETGIDQSDDMNKTIEGLIQIYGLNDVIDIEGEITGANTGDYAQLNSEPKKSQIIDGKYKFTGVIAGNHTFSVFSKDGELRGSTPITIKMGKVANTDNGIITVTETSKSVSVNITSVSSTLSMDIGTITQTEPKPSKPTTPYESGTLAEAIYKNAEGVTDEQMATGIAKLSEPITIPGRSGAADNEATLSWTDDNYTETTNIPSYYFRGQVENNYVDFAGMCWRIVRIDGNSNIKLIIADDEGVCNREEYSKDNMNSILGRNACLTGGMSSFVGIPGLTALNAWMNGGEYNTNINDYGSCGWSESQMETLTSHISQEEQQKLVDNAEWCNDISIINEESNIYSPYERLKNESAMPTNECNQVGLNNSSARLIESIIGIITADEAAFAGAIYTSSSSIVNHYLKDNAYIREGWDGIMHTMTPAGNNISNTYGNSGEEYSDFHLTKNGVLIAANVGDYDAQNLGSLRPMVVLKNTSDFVNNGTGEPGTQTNPYVIE